MGVDILVNQGNIEGVLGNEVLIFCFVMDMGDMMDDEISDDEFMGLGGIKKWNVNGVRVELGEIQIDQGYNLEWDEIGEVRKFGFKFVFFKFGFFVVEEYEVEEDVVISL